MLALPGASQGSWSLGCLQDRAQYQRAMCVGWGWCHVCSRKALTHVKTSHEWDQSFVRRKALYFLEHQVFCKGFPLKQLYVL